MFLGNCCIPLFYGCWEVVAIGRSSAQQSICKRGGCNIPPCHATSSPSSCGTATMCYGWTHGDMGRRVSSCGKQSQLYFHDDASLEQVMCLIKFGWAVFTATWISVHCSSLKFRRFKASERWCKLRSFIPSPRNHGRSAASTLIQWQNPRHLWKISEVDRR